MFTPGRLSLARRRRRLTKKGLAEAIGVAPHTVLRYESGEISPSDNVIKNLSQFLEFPVEFFFGEDVDEPIEGAASFRSLSAMSAKDRDAALAVSALAFIFTDWIVERFDLPHQDLIDLSGEEPDVAARSLRQKWGMGERPIKNIVHLLEAKGVRVFSLTENTNTVDAYSLWRNDTPYMFLNMMKTPERSRFDAAHELGHLVLHKHGGPSGRRAEDDANRFAASFMMSSADVLAIMPRVSNLNQIVQGKKRWAVSVAALNHRLHKLKITTDWQYRTFSIQLTEQGYRVAEPDGIAREQSVVWQKVLTVLWTEKITKNDIANAIHIPAFEIENLLVGLTNPHSISDSVERIHEETKLKLIL